MKATRPLSNVLLHTTNRTHFSPRATTTTNTSLRPVKYDKQPKRSFFGNASNPLSAPNPFSPNQTLTAQRTLNYPPSVIYTIISDVASYSQFLPYCQGSEVTKYSSPAKDGKKYPEEAKLIIGFNGSISEEFTSRVYCVPDRIVEAVSGNMPSTLSGEEIAHHSPRASGDQDPSRKNTVMASLLTRWTLRPYPYKPPPASAIHRDTAHKNTVESSSDASEARTEVSLAVEYQFSNPLYSALSSAAAPKIADKMIEAFEKRFKEVVEGAAKK